MIGKYIAKNGVSTISRWIDRSDNAAQSKPEIYTIHIDGKNAVPEATKEEIERLKGIGNHPGASSTRSSGPD